MRPIALAALLSLSLFPSAVVAQSSTPAAPMGGSPASWSIGAGLLSAPVSFNITMIAGQFVSSPSIPSVTASLERRLSDRSWAVVGVTGGIFQESQDVPSGSVGITKNDATQLAVSAGVRHVLTPAGAPVAVSVIGLAEGGLLRWDVDAVNPSPLTYEVDGWSLGVNAGIAIDRELVNQISLRLATPLAAVVYSSSESRETGLQTLDASRWSANVLIAPRLEVRVAF